MVLLRFLRDEAAHATARIALEARVKFEVKIGAGKISEALQICQGKGPKDLKPCF